MKELEIRRTIQKIHDVANELEKQLPEVDVNRIDSEPAFELGTRLVMLSGVRYRYVKLLLLDGEGYVTGGRAYTGTQFMWFRYKELEE